METKPFNYLSTDKTIKQTLLDEYPHKQSNRIALDHICELINLTALKIHDMDYYEAVRYIVNLIGNTVLPNSVIATLEFQLFKYRYFYWSKEELKGDGVKVE